MNDFEVFSAWCYYLGGYLLLAVVLSAEGAILFWFIHGSSQLRRFKRLLACALQLPFLFACILFFCTLFCVYYGAYLESFPYSNEQQQCTAMGRVFLLSQPPHEQLLTSEEFWSANQRHLLKLYWMEYVKLAIIDKYERTDRRQNGSYESYIRRHISPFKRIRYFCLTAQERELVLLLTPKSEFF